MRQNLENIMDQFQGEMVDDLLILSGSGLYDLVRPPPCALVCPHSYWNYLGALDLQAFMI